MKFLIIILLFLTFWVVIIAGCIYLIRRLSTPRPSRDTCCLAVPCSAKCAEHHQAARDRLAIEYDKIVHEIGEIVTVGRGLEGGAAEDTGRPAGTWTAAS